MKNRILFILVTILLMAPLHLHGKVILPDSCGDEKVQFKVTTTDDHAQALKPEEGKALLVIVEEGISKHFDLTTRYGLDGKWVGATHSDSYFLIQIDPGEHHLCAAPQGHFGFSDKDRMRLVNVLAFTADAGKVYFFGGKESTSGTPGHTVWVNPPAGTTAPPTAVHTAGTQTLNMEYSFFSEDEGKYRVKAGKLASWKQD